MGFISQDVVGETSQTGFSGMLGSESWMAREETENLLDTVKPTQNLQMKRNGNKRDAETRPEIKGEQY